MRFLDKIIERPSSVKLGSGLTSDVKNFVKWFRRSFNDYSHVFDMESLIGKLRTDFDPRGPIPTHEVNGRVDTSGGLYNDGMIHHMRKADSEFTVNFTATA